MKISETGATKIGTNAYLTEDPFAIFATGRATWPVYVSNAKRYKEIPEFHYVTSHPDKFFTTDDHNNKQDLLQNL